MRSSPSSTSCSARRRCLLAVVAGLCAVALAPSPVRAEAAPPAPAARFAPPPGKLLLIVGQDTESIDAYTKAMGTAPTGVTEYTAVRNLEGMETRADYGSGPHDMDYLMRQYPRSVLAIGYYLVRELENIASGRLDASIDKFLRHLATYRRPVFVRFGYEFDGPWNDYEPELYKKAWRHFRGRMQALGVRNVVMVWQSAASVTRENKPFTDWYPGDDEVDWVAVSLFPGMRGPGIAPVQARIDFARQHAKPLLIAESTPRGYDIQQLLYGTSGRKEDQQPRSPEQIWSEWFAPYFRLIYKNNDVIRAVAYINSNWDAQPMWGPPHRKGYWGDTRVEVNPVIFEHWKAEVNGPKWLQGGPQLFQELGYVPEPGR